MKQIKSHTDIINELLFIEHKNIAHRLNFITNNAEISDELLYKSIGVIDYYSRFNDEYSKQVVVVLSSILYTYRKKHWEGLFQFLVIIFSRIGFAPSAIMIDENYNHELNQFSSFDSFISEINTVINQIRNEIIVSEKVFLLTSFQKDIWDKCLNSNFVGISAPTSAGKSFIIILKAIDNILNKGGNIIYVVPTLSLISQVTNDFHDKLKEFDIRNYEILTRYKEGDKENKIYVLTPERTISAYSDDDNPFGDVNTFIVDEIQNIERIDSEKDERAKILFDSLVELSFNDNPNLIIFSGPRVSGLKEMGYEIFDDIDAVEIQTLSSPVVSFTYSVLKKKSKYFLKQYCQLNNSFTSLEIENFDKVEIGGKQYKSSHYNYLAHIVESLGRDNKNVIFAPTAPSAKKIALNLTERLDFNYSSNNFIISLQDYIVSTVHLKYDLIETLNKRVAYHHGKVPIHIRNVLEYAIREKMINNIVCTTTLMQGVNIPVQNVIMRNSFLSTRSVDGVMPKLTNYEISNLRGRAGRLLKDIIGRTFVLDENAFDNENNQTTLFNDENKKLLSGYGYVYNKSKQEIDDVILNNYSTNKVHASDVHFLISYIRYTILKHNEHSFKRLKAVGIFYSKKQINQINTDLKEILSIPLELCFKNRYIDPLILNDIYIKTSEFNLPNEISDYYLANKLYELVKKIQEDFPLLYTKCFSNRELPKSFFYTVSNWVKEKSLKEILNNSFFNDSNNIDNEIDKIQKDICFNLTALLKPFYIIQYGDAKFVNCIEMGAYSPITTKLINLNIPREVALILKKTIFKDFNGSDIEVDILKKVINENWADIDFWNQIQLKHLFNSDR